MSQENVELGWQAARAWNDGEDSFLEYLDADVEWHPPAESMEPGIYADMKACAITPGGSVKSSRNDTPNRLKSSTLATRT